MFSAETGCTLPTHAASTERPAHRPIFMVPPMWSERHTCPELAVRRVTFETRLGARLPERCISPAVFRVALKCAALFVSRQAFPLNVELGTVPTANEGRSLSRESAACVLRVPRRAQCSSSSVTLEVKLHST